MNPLGKSGFFICVISLFLVLYRVKKVVNKRILCLDSYRSRWSGMAFHSLLQRRFAPRKMVHLPSFRSRMTGRYLLLLCKKRFFVYYQSCPFRRLTPPPSPCPGTAFYVSHFLIFRFYSYLLSIFICLLINFTKSCCSPKSGSLAITLRQIPFIKI